MTHIQLTPPIVMYSELFHYHLEQEHTLLFKLVEPQPTSGSHFLRNEPINAHHSYACI